MPRFLPLAGTSSGKGLLLFIIVITLQAASLLSLQTAAAAIYTCTAKDGSRIFSDEKCGPDAKLVGGITTETPPTEPPETIDTLSGNAEGITHFSPQTAQSCSSSTDECNNRGARVITGKAACANGSLPDCEEQYCRNGITGECRRHILNVAQISGDEWYLRQQGPVQSDGAIKYYVRCFGEDQREIRDLTITCSAITGPNRCYSNTPQSGFARLDLAASKYCAARQ